MKPIDIRNGNWSTIRAGLTGRLQAIYAAWLAHGPGTTRAVALRSGRDLLSLRPRTTDLYQLGLVELVGRDPREGGIYRARSQAEWEQWQRASAAPGASGQQLLL